MHIRKQSDQLFANNIERDGVCAAIKDCKNAYVS